MAMTETPKHVLKRASSWVTPIIHAKAKASAAMHGQKFQEWISEAISEKLAREEKARK